MPLFLTWEALDAPHQGTLLGHIDSCPSAGLDCGADGVSGEGQDDLDIVGGAAVLELHVRGARQSVG